MSRKVRVDYKSCLTKKFLVTVLSDDVINKYILVNMVTVAVVATAMVIIVKIMTAGTPEIARRPVLGLSHAVIMAIAEPMRLGPEPELLIIK